MRAFSSMGNMFFLAIFVVLGVAVRECAGQGAGAFDLGDHREGQLSGQLSPLNIFAIVLGCLAALVACGITAVCAFFTYKRYAEERESDPRHQYKHTTKTQYYGA